MKLELEEKAVQMWLLAKVRTRVKESGASCKMQGGVPLRAFLYKCIYGRRDV